MKDRAVLVGVTGGIAAFKAAALVSQMVQAGARVQVIMTRVATQFVGPATFAALTGRPVATDVVDPCHRPLGWHVTLAEQAELLCIAPATANCMAKIACGIADDLLSTTTLAFPGPTILAPAMNPDMWAKPAVQRNLDRIRQDGAIIVGPDQGWVSCRRTGPGRMAEPEQIFHEIELQFESL